MRAPAQALEYESIVARVARDRPGAVLDWGCGHGQVTDLLARTGLSVTASGAWAARAAPLIWRASRALARVTLLNIVAIDIDLVAFPRR